MDIVGQYGATEEESEQIANILDQTPELMNGFDGLNDTENQCQPCRIRESQKKLRLDSIRAKLSHALRLDVLGIPNVTRTRLPKVPSYERLQQQYENELNLNEMQNDQAYSYAEQLEDEEDEFGIMERTFIFSEDPPTSLGIEAPNAIYFDISHMEDRLVYQAHLWVYIEQRRQYDLPQNVTEMFLYKLVSPGKRLGPPVKRFIKKRKKSIADTSGWHQFDITELVHSWVTDPSSNLGVVVEAFDVNNENLIVLPNGSSRSGYEPNLDFKTTTALHENRRKRDAGIDCNEQNQFETCCRYPLIVDFEEFKWDFVIAPLHYDAYYCAGECRNEGLSQSGHAAVVQQVSASSIIGGSNPGPCCTPARMSSLTMLYFDHNLRVQLTTLPKMKVERCGCA